MAHQEAITQEVIYLKAYHAVIDSHHIHLHLQAVHQVLAAIEVQVHKCLIQMQKLLQLMQY